MLEEYFTPCPLIAILRGLPLKDAPAVADILVEQGFTMLEIPLNSPSPLETIQALSQHLPAHVLLGAGTVTQTQEVEQVHAAGGRMVFSPNSDPRVIRHTQSHGMLSVPGCATPTEAFHALDAGDDILKFFPAEVLGVKGVKA